MREVRPHPDLRLPAQAAGGQIIKCPMEYGGEVEHNGILRGPYGECLCVKLHFTPCPYIEPPTVVRATPHPLGLPDDFKQGD